MRLTTTLFVLITTLFVLSGDAPAPAQKEPPPVLPAPKADAPPKADVAPSVPTYNAALALARADAKTLDPVERLRVRYIFVANGDTEEAQAIGDAVNRLSRSAVIRRPLWLGKGRLLVLRIDAGWYAASAKDLADWLTAWEELRFDPAGSLLLTPDSLTGIAKLLGVTEFERPWKDGDKIAVEKIQADAQKASKDNAVLRVFAPDVDNEALLELMQMLGTTAPLVAHDYFVARGLASIKDADKFGGLYGALYGGLYYDFAGIPGTFDELLEQLGVGSVKHGIKADDLFNRLRSDKRVGINRSKVVSKRPRRVDYVPILSSDVFASRGFLANTFDLKRADLDIGMHPLANLLKTFRQTTFHETLHVGANGLLVASLWDDQFKLAEKAPDDLVKDHTVPSPFYGELQSIVSCMACHEATGHGGWIPTPNDVQRLGNLGVAFDLTTKDQIDALDRVRGLFTGNAEDLLRPARDTQNRAVLAATGPWKRSKKENTDAAELSAGTLVSIWRRYFYDDVTPRVSLLDAGWDVPEEKALAAFKGLTALPPGALENVTIGLLRAGVEIGRYEHDQVRHLIGARIAATLKDNPKLLEGMK